VTPVASGIANTEKDRFMLFLGTCKRFFSPGAPVDRIVGMLEQVWAFFVYEGVWSSFFLIAAVHESHLCVIVLITIINSVQVYKKTLNFLHDVTSIVSYKRRK
jgi:hypothetical protein